MSIKILGGMAKGTTLILPDLKTLRPTSVILRRKLFDATQNVDYECLVDFFAGTGGIGLEAASRGVLDIIFIEYDKSVQGFLKKNIESLKMSFQKQGHEVPRIKIYEGAFNKFFKLIKETYLAWPNDFQKKVVFFFDPPYEKYKEIGPFLIQEFFEDNWFKGQLWIESDEKKGRKLKDWPGEGHKVLTQGDSYILLVKP